MKTGVIIITLALLLFTAASAEAYTLSGDISGGVFLGGITYIYAVSTDFSSGIPAFYIGLALLGNGTYLIFNVPEGDYILFAYQDRDYNLMPSPNDYYGFYGDTLPEVLTVAANVEDLDITIAPLPFTVIQGTITYTGGSAGLTWVQAATDPAFENIAGFTMVLDTAGSGNYTLFADSGQYYIRAFMDLDWNFQLSPSDPNGYFGYPNPPQMVTVSGSSIDDIDFTIFDPADVTVNLTPMQPAIVIPPQGGAFNYIFNIVNNSASAVTLQVWSEAILPDGSVYGPIILRTVTIPSDGSLTRSLVQSVPGSAPAGDYTYRARAGTYPSIVAAEDSFDFIKEAGGNRSGGSDNWGTTGWDDNAPAAVINAQFRLLPAYPNPFNPETTVSFDLQHPAMVELSLYTIQGRLLEKIASGYYPAGNSQIKIALQDYPSGIYLLSASGGGITSAQKLLLMK